MSRIYQGGGSDRRYKGRTRDASFQPYQVASNEKELRQQGQQVLDNLRTQERERQRADQAYNLQQASGARAAELNLRAEQSADAAMFQLTQNAERFALQRVQLGEQQLLKKTSLEGQQALANDLLAQKQGLQTGLLQQSQLAQRGELDRKQGLETTQLKSNQQLNRNLLGAKQALETLQTTENLGRQQLQLMQRQNLGMSQLGQRQAQAYEFQIANTELGIAMRAQEANQALDRQYLQTQQVLEQSALAKQRAGVNALLSFADIALKSAELGFQYKEQKDREAEAEAKQQQEAAMYYEWLYTDDASVIQSDGSVNPVVQQESVLQDSEISYESGVQVVSQGNPVIAEEIRQPEADATMNRQLRKLDVAEAGMSFKPQLFDLVNDPNFAIQGPNGPITLTSARSRGELQMVVMGAAKELTTQYNLPGKDQHAVLVAYGKQVRAAVNEVVQQYGAQMAQANKSERYESGISAGSSLLMAGDAQAGWNEALTAAQTSGNFMGKSQREINTATLKDLMSRLPDNRLADLKTVRKNKNQKGTEFGNDRFYNDMIDDEIRSRRNEIVSEADSIQDFNNLQVDEITDRMNQQLLFATDGEAGDIRAQAISDLQAIGSPEAIDEITSLRKAGLNLNQNTFLDLVEGFESGEPPTQEQISTAYRYGYISNTQFNNLKNRGETGDVISRKISEAGIDSSDKLAYSVIYEAMQRHPASLQVDVSELKSRAKVFAANLSPDIDREIRQFVVGNPDATQGQIQQEVGKILNKYSSQMDSGESPRLTYSREEGWDFKFNLDRPAPLQVRKNPYTGQIHKIYTGFNATQIPTTASPVDLILSRDELLADVKVLQEGGENYSARTRVAAQRLGMQPWELIKKQVFAHGFPSIDSLSNKPVSFNPDGPGIDPGVMQALNVLGKYESDTVGKFNAVNQIGRDGGTRTEGYSGDIRNMSQHGGRALIDMSISDIMALQARQPISDSQWISEGRLHAVGRYQFIGSTLAAVVKQTGIDPNLKFTPEVQNYLAAYLLQSSRSGIAQWVGPNSYATTAERAVVAQQRQRLQHAYRILRNPNSGPIQRQRAERIIGNPFS